MKILSIAEFLEPGEVPPCPICGEYIYENDYIVIGKVDDLICMCHAECGNTEFFDA